MSKRDHKLRQIASVAEVEPFGGLQFLTHLVLLGFGSIAAYVLFGDAYFGGIYVVYAVLMVLEKKVAEVAYRAGDASRYREVLGLLFLRASAYNVLVFQVWRGDNEIFKLAALALLVASTINIMVFHTTYRAVMVCVVLPNWLGFSAIALNVVWKFGWSPEALGALITVICISPYFFLALISAHNRWQQQETTKTALSQSQRLDGMGKIAGGVSHDFNNILSVVSGSLQLLAQETDPDERKRLLDVANRAIESGARLNKQLLAMGKRSALLPQTTNLAGAVRDFEAFATNILPASIRFEIIPTPANPHVFVDGQMLQTALLNLALNSKSAMPAGGRLRISYGNASAQEAQAVGLRGAQGYAMLSVEDTGSGMDALTAEQVFEPFFTTRAVGGGSGLGLPMVKGFAEQSKGSLTLTSALGKGTKVTLFLPLSESQSASEPPAKAMGQPAARPKTNAKILVVEDNAPLLNIIALKLKRDGFNVLTCEDGDRAAQVLEGDRDFDLVLCDIVMPGEVQGFDLLRKVRAQAPELPFVLMTGYADTEKRRDEGALAQADLVLDKPLNLQNLSHEIMRLLHTRR